MGAYPCPARRDVAQQRVETSAVAPLMNWVDPDQHAIDCGEPGAHRVGNVIFIDHRFGIDAKRGERCEDGSEPAGLCVDVAACRFIAPPKDSHAASTIRFRHGIPSHAAAEPG